MPYIKADSPAEQKMFDYLEELRKSGDTNMYGASPYLEHAFGLDRRYAVDVLSKWMTFHDDPARRLDGPLTKQRPHKMKTAFVGGE